MPPVTSLPSAPSPPPPSGGDHSGHNVASAPSTVGNSFANVLAQTISQVNPQSNGSAHGDHGGTPGASGSVPGQHASISSVIDPSEGRHPGHIPLKGSVHGVQHGLQQVALGVRAYRQQLIASNIANADTPGYQAVDIDFKEALNLALSGSGTTPLSLAATSAGHLAGTNFSALPPFPLKYHTPSQASADGNTVEMDVERAKFAENAVMYEYSLDRVKGHFMMTAELLKNLPY
jgi:flagellar basal-body rod protein FlgB